MQWIIRSFSKQPLSKSPLTVQDRQRDRLSEWRWYHDGGNNRRLRNEKRRAEPLSDERRRIRGGQEARVICRERKQALSKPLFHSPVSFRRAEVIHVYPSNAVGSSARVDLKGEQSFGSERRRGELWPLSGSPWWLLLCLLSLQTFVAHFSLFLCSQTVFCPADPATDPPPKKHSLMLKLPLLILAAVWLARHLYFIAN